MYRWNKQVMVVDCAMEMMKKKEKVSFWAYVPPNWINGRSFTERQQQDFKQVLYWVNFWT